MLPARLPSRSKLVQTTFLPDIYNTKIHTPSDRPSFTSLLVLVRLASLEHCSFVLGFFFFISSVLGLAEGSYTKRKSPKKPSLVPASQGGERARNRRLVGLVALLAFAGKAWAGRSNPHDHDTDRHGSRRKGWGWGKERRLTDGIDPSEEQIECSTQLVEWCYIQRRYSYL